MPNENALSDYLGDGVHAQYDAVHGQIWLMVQRCDDPFGEKPEVRIERVCLEPEVFESLCRFAARCWPMTVKVEVRDDA